MPLDVPGRPGPGRFGPRDYTRRRLFALAGALATAGASDLAWHALRGTSGGTQRLSTAGDPSGGLIGHRPAGSPTPHPTVLPGSPTPGASPRVTPSPSASVSASASAHPPPAGRHGSGDKPGRGTHTARHRVEHVTLPPATVDVQSRPAYAVHDLLPDAPHRAIALTIDDGPDPEWTPKVLRLLDKYRVQATFCVVGVHVAAYPGLVRDVHRAGHAIVNHTWSHPLPFASLTEKQIVAQISRNQRAIEAAAGVTPQLFRAPGGEWSPFVYRAIAAYGLRPLDWDIDPADWATPGTRKIIRRMQRAKPDDIVLCHDGGGDRHETVQALRTVIPSWKRRNLDLVTLLLPSQLKVPAQPTTSPTPAPPPAPSTSGSPTA
jgi:peptidoglycan/xylan/chitin deacetylase (PgdA/CDA1 family)